MAKKKNSQFLPGLLEDIMSVLTPEEQEIAFELFNYGANQVDEELSHIYYHHQCPDYRLIAQPIASYLMPLWTMETDGICRAVFTVLPVVQAIFRIVIANIETHDINGLWCRCLLLHLSA